MKNRLENLLWFGNDTVPKLAARSNGPGKPIAAVDPPPPPDHTPNEGEHHENPARLLSVALL